MKERQLICNAREVRAIQSGAMTQTRRIVKTCRQFAEWDSSPEGAYDVAMADNGSGAHFLVAGDHGYTNLVPCPYGQPGDRLAVRETWRYCGWTEDGLPFVEYQADGAQRLCDRGISEEWAEKLMGIWADLSAPQNFELDGRAADRRWRPSIHMPRWASRLTLEIIGVRVEPLQAISEADAWAEGCMRGDPNDAGGWFPADEPDPSGIGERGWDCARDWFADLWESINGPDSWGANPWVWRISFKVI